ncbi:SIMPL domain-containing protein [Belliella sp. DSM 107340]|uniref:SIMPL domain-containing protein n=1 Tax=Belliella calami TaxID=2923436 RepID=A0ABS9ULP9_9BACT|nr:SIMPL domain-containing protein [Belliella calami]
MSNLKNNWILRNEIQSIKQYELLVKDAETVSKVFKELNSLGISSFSIDRLENSEIEKYKREAKSKAIKQAKENAETLVQAIGQELGRALLISEENYPQNITGMLQGRVAGIRIRGASSLSSNWETTPEIEFEKIKIEYQVKVLFELK